MSSNKKKICFVSAGLAGGGMERSLTSLANYFAEIGHQVIIVNIFRSEVFFNLHTSITVIWPNLDRENTHKMLYAVRLLPYLRREIQKTKADAVLSFGEWFNAYVILSLMGTKQRLFISDRMGPLLKLGFPLDQANKLLYKHATGIIAQTQTAKKIIASKTKAKSISVIPNAVVPIDVTSLKKEKRIITVGRLSREKGHEILLDAFAKLQDKSWTLDIVGDGPKRRSLEEQAQFLGIAERVVFHGHQKHFGALLGRAYIFVLPSYYEGFPNALVEAMSVPLAVISSDCVAGPSEIITHGQDGLLFEPGNVDALFDCLTALTCNENQCDDLASNAFKVRERFAFELMSKKYLSILISDFD
jgi:GalNAc-alpha-(1->4)-GalNAc-alpha-(1->3)-diNAcBac-PP-undecaprenol alpha-1,4-N-acetyl-D-galactosaminyltransferase